MLSSCSVIFAGGTILTPRSHRTIDRKLAEQLRRDYPNHIPVKVAAQLLGFSDRRLAKLVADGREPFAGIGANIGINQRYIRIYTERLISYLSGAVEHE